MKRLVLIGLVMALTAMFSAGCYQTGKVAGETVKGVEQGASDVKKGYEDAKKSK